MSQGNVIVGARGVSKSFDGIAALDGVDFQVHENESVALLGANGAGKSTLVRLLTGAMQPDSGDILINGSVRRLRSVSEAREQGIGFIPQELCIAPDLTVAENVLVSGWQRVGLHVSHAEELERVRKICARIGLKASPNERVLNLSPTEQRLIMIARSLVATPRILILDEPTAALADAEANRIIDVLNELRSEGLSIIYISHRMDEIARVCDSLVALRGGKVVFVGPANSESIREAIGLSIEGKHRHEGGATPTTAAIGSDAKPALSCRNLSNGRLREVSIAVRSGEVVGLCGLLGSGRSELLRALAGADRVQSGSISVSGDEVTLRSPNDAVARGIGLLPEDRRNQGALLNLSVRENLTLPRIPNRMKMLRPRLEKQAVTKAVSDYGIKSRSAEIAVSTLSGGNQQKVILARWLLAESRILLLDEPTAGIDIGAKAELLDSVRKRADEGLAVVMASSETKDLVEYCDRIYIMRDGRIIHEIIGSSTVEELTEWCNSN